MKPIATDIYTFANLVGDGCVYVDKTDRLLGHVSRRLGNQFFFSRPRRFGKSLTVSTLRALGRIRERGYAERYRATGRRITLIGINFPSRARQIDDLVSEEFK